MVRLLALRRLLKPARLALALFRDARVPVHAKAVLGLVALYVLSPVDLVPEWIPVLGQLDDLAAIAAGLTLFVRLCPPEVVEQHEARLGMHSSKTVEGRARPVRPEYPGGPYQS